jgi:hypothetical protein
MVKSAFAGFRSRFARQMPIFPSGGASVPVCCWWKGVPNEKNLRDAGGSRLAVADDILRHGSGSDDSVAISPHRDAGRWLWLRQQRGLRDELCGDLPRWLRQRVLGAVVPLAVL